MKNNLLIIAVLLFTGSVKATNNSALMPAVIINFQAVQNGNNVHLSWQTTSEINNNYFSVERSTDSLTFNSLGVIAGGGNSSTTLNYSFIDSGISIAQKYYYRLKLTDFGGSITYSEIISIDYVTGIATIINQQFTLNVFPNPGKEEIIIRVESEIKIKEPRIEVYDITGEKVKEIPVNGKEVKISVANLLKGVYFVRLKDKEGKEYSAEKIIKE